MSEKIPRETVLMQIGHKHYKVKKILHDWRLSKAQFKSMMENTRVDDWYYKTRSHFDGMVDCVVDTGESFRPLTESIKNEILEDIDRFEYRVDYDSSRDVFEIWSLALGTMELMRKANSGLVIELLEYTRKIEYR